MRDSSILVVDEAVSNLDGANEEALQSAIGTAREGRTTPLVVEAAQLIAADGEHARLLARQTSDVIDLGCAAAARL